MPATPADASTRIFIHFVGCLLAGAYASGWT
jgi:hypothetical protein